MQNFFCKPFLLPITFLNHLQRPTSKPVENIWSKMLKAMYFQKNSSRFIVKIVFIMTSLSFFFKRYHVLSMKGDIQLCQKRIDIPFRITHTISAIRARDIFSLINSMNTLVPHQ